MNSNQDHTLPTTRIVIFGLIFRDAQASGEEMSGKSMGTSTVQTLNERQF